MEINPQVIIDEMMKKINGLTAENIVLQSQIRQLSDALQQQSKVSVSPSTVMSNTVDSEGKYEEAVAEGRMGPPPTE